MHLYCAYRKNESDALISGDEDESVADTEVEEPLPATHDDTGEETETDTEGPDTTTQK